MVAIALCNDRSNGENTGGVARRETAALTEHGNVALKKRVGEIAGGWHRIRAKPPADQFHRHMRYGAIEIRFTHQKSGLLGIGTFPDDAVEIKGSRNENRHNSGIRAAENLVILVKGRSVIPQVNHDVRIRGHQAARYANHAYRGQKVLPLERCAEETTTRASDHPAHGSADSSR